MAGGNAIRGSRIGAGPMGEAERQEILASRAWFSKRYPTPGERLAAARRAYKQWARSIPSLDGRKETG